MFRAKIANHQKPAGRETPLRPGVVNGIGLDAQGVSELCASHLLDDVACRCHTAPYPSMVGLSSPTTGCLLSERPCCTTLTMSDSKPNDGKRPDYSEIGERLSAARQVLFPGATQTEWAKHNGFAPNQWNNWEVGARRISVDAAEVLCRRYGLTLDFIYLGRSDGLPEILRKSL